MKLIDQVCSLELSRQLEALGVPQESLWWWKASSDKWYLSSTSIGINNWYPKRAPKEKYSAFTLAELGMILPLGYSSWRREADFGCESGDGKIFIEADTEANARAKTLKYLLENKLITLGN